MIIHVNAVYWDVMPCTLVGKYQCLGQTCCRHLHDIRANHATKLKYKHKERRDRGRRIERTKEGSKQGGEILSKKKGKREEGRVGWRTGPTTSSVSMVALCIFLFLQG
jgi:ribosomal protein S28E/S33